MINFVGRFKEAREYLGMNKSDFAKKLGIAPSTATRYENGMDITAGAIDKIATKLGMSTAWLLGLADEMYDVEIAYKKIPIIGRVIKLPAFDYSNFEGFEMLRNTYKVDFCVKTNETTFFKKQNTAENGDLVAVLVDQNVMVRRYFKYGKQIVLKEEGTKNEITVENVEILGKAVLTLSEVE